MTPSLTPSRTLYHRTQQPRSRATVAARTLSCDPGAVEPGTDDVLFELIVDALVGVGS
jgi:hypothetical protein